MAVRQQKEKVGHVLSKYKKDKSALIDVLHDTQSEIGYLPREALDQVSDGLGVPLSRVYSVATFFKAFSLEPRGRHLINVCMGTACHVRGADRVLEKMETLETVNCVGACALGPMVIIGEDYHGEMTPEKVSEVLKNYK